jgi:anaerobic ribonucleoside-triphosphate reductase
MYLKVTYDQDFDDLLMHLRSKYPKHLFDMDGIGEQLDLSKFSKKFFGAKATTADLSIDANANVDDATVISYSIELKKPFERINSYYMLWKELRRVWGTAFANEIVEMNLTGDIYIHDMHGIGAGTPYSYLGTTSIIVRGEDKVPKLVTMESLFNKYVDNCVSMPDRDTIKLSDLEILDDNQSWTRLTDVLRHRPHNKLLKIETYGGYTTVVTEDHPVILYDGSEVKAASLTVGDKVKNPDAVKMYTGDLPLSTDVNILDEWAYLVGFYLGDGHIHYSSPERNSGQICITQKHLPEDVLNWNESAKYALISGLIDSDGTINTRDKFISIRVSSLALVSQVADLIRKDENFAKVKVKFLTQATFTNKDMYEVQFQLVNPVLNASDKVTTYIRSLDRVTGAYKSGEANQICKISYLENTPEFVYDITTGTGQFYSQGMIQHNCWNYSAYDVMTKGLPMIKKIKSTPPQYLYSFKSQLEQFIVIAANSTLGATGLADLFIVMSYYVKNILETKSDAHFKFETEEDCWAYIKETIVSFIYTINQPNRSGLQCVTEDTEVLTPSGWKTHDTLNVDDDIYTWNNGTLNIQKVNAINVGNFNGLMHAYSGRGINQVVTPNHKVLYKKYNSLDYILTDSSNIIENKTPIDIPVAMLNDYRPDYAISNDMLNLITIILTDGTLMDDGRIRIFKSENRYGHELIINTLDALNYDYTITSCDDGFGCGNKVIKYTISASNTSELLILLDNTKTRIPKWMFKLSKKQAQMVIDLWAQFDGHTEDNGRQKLQCDNYNIADAIQHICFLSGHGSSISSRLIGDNKTETIYVNPYKNINKTGHQSKVRYNGIIWCPSTDDGIVVYRKDGKVFISGNSPYTNVSVYDRQFIDRLKDDYLFPDGSNPDPDVVMALQEMYIDIMNEELSRTPATFPVTSACFSVDDELNLNDMEFTRMIAEKSVEYGFMNFYIGKTSTVSSCCFDGNELVIHSNRRTQTQEIESLRNLYQRQLDNIWVESKVGIYAKGKVIRAPFKGHSMYKIETASGQLINATEDHLWPIAGSNDDIRTDELEIGMGLQKTSRLGVIEPEVITKISKVAYTDDWVYCIVMDNEKEPYFILANGIRTHNCRLRSDMQEMPGYVNSIGGGSTKLGSLGVVSMNLPRAAIQAKGDLDTFYARIEYLTLVAARINSARRRLVQKRIDNGNHPLYDHGFIDIEKQYSTAGINGLNEALYFLGHDVLTPEGQGVVLETMTVINNQNLKNDAHYKFLHNVEQVPAENMAIKMAEKDKLMKVQDEFDLYSNQFIPLTVNADMLDRLKLNGMFDKVFSGGSICHINVEQRVSAEKIEELIQLAAKLGVIYWAINYNLQECEDAHLTVGKGDTCSICGKLIINEFTRVVGFLTNVRNWHQIRREQDYPQRQFYLVE